MKKLTVFLATGLGLGYTPVLPGTAGSLLGVALFWGLRSYPKLWLGVFAVLLFAFSSWIADRAEKIFGSKDCQKIVIDEVVGQFITLLFLPVVFAWWSVAIGFLLFRIFDVIKIFPARWAQDNIAGGLGVVLDDVVAGIQAGVLLWGIMLWL